METFPSALLGANTLEAARLLLRNSELAQHWVRSNGACRACSEMSILREWCTVRVCGPRRSGHTTAIRTLAMEFGHNQVIVIGPTHAQVQYYRDLPYVAGVGNLKALHGPLAGMGISAIFVDCASAIKGKHHKAIRELAIRHSAGPEPFYLVLFE